MLNGTFSLHPLLTLTEALTLFQGLQVRKIRTVTDNNTAEDFYIPGEFVIWIL